MWSTPTLTLSIAYGQDRSCLGNDSSLHLRPREDIEQKAEDTSSLRRRLQRHSRQTNRSPSANPDPALRRIPLAKSSDSRTYSPIEHGNNDTSMRTIHGPLSDHRMRLILRRRGIIRRVKVHNSPGSHRVQSNVTDDPKICTRRVPHNSTR
jgi:hypothetical protein